MPSTGALPTASTEISKTKYLTGGPIHRIGTAQGDREITHLARPTRPGHGERGSRVQLFTNYFKLRAKPDLVLHRYSITVIPELKGKKLDKIINNVLDLPQFNALRLGIATDFSAFMVSCTLLSQDHQNFSVPMATGLSVDELRNAKKYAVLISFVSTFVLSQFDGTKPYLADQESLPVVQDLDIVLGHHRKSSQDVAAVGKRKVFSMNPPATYADFPGVLKALRGFFCNVRFCENGPLVNVNVSNSPFWKQGPLTNVVRALQTDGEINDTKIPALLRGLRVQLIYIKDKTVFRTISGYACHGDGDGYMPHPPRVPRGIFGPGPEDVQFFWEKNPPNGKRKEERNDSKVKPHAPGCSCVGKYVSVSSYFAESTYIYHHDSLAIIDEQQSTGYNLIAMI